MRVLWLGEDIGLAQELGPFFRARGLEAEVVLAAEGAGSTSADVALAYFPDPGAAGGLLCSATGLRMMVWPPLIAIVARSPAKADLERMRRQGVVHVCREVDATFGNVVKRLVDPASCGEWALSRGRLVDALHSAESASASGMLVVRCPHGTGASSYPWENSTLFYCGDTEQGKCTGWAGRIYLVGGAITLAETPQARGVHALQQMLQLADGSVMRFPFYLSPEITDPLGPAAAAAAAAARANEATKTARVGERRAGAERAPAAPAAPAVRPEPPRAAPSKEKSMSELDSVLSSSSSFVGAVRVAANGNPLGAAGDIDAPMLAAVVHLAAEHVQGVAATLPLGSVLGFSVGGRAGAYFVRHEAKSRTTLVVRSTTAQTPSRTLAELSRFG